MGKIEDYQLNDDSQLKKVNEIALNSDSKENLALSVDVDKNSTRVLASASRGFLTLVDLAAPVPIVQQWKAHSIEYCEQIEAWTCAFDRFRENVLYSGKSDSIS